MTPKEKADGVIVDYLEKRGFSWTEDLARIVEQAIKIAIEEEREACAQVCEAYANDYQALTDRAGGSVAQYAVSAGNKLAHKIRARGKQ